MLSHCNCINNKKKKTNDHLLENTVYTTALLTLLLLLAGKKLKNSKGRRLLEFSTQRSTYINHIIFNIILHKYKKLQKPTLDCT